MADRDDNLDIQIAEDQSKIANDLLSDPTQNYS